MFRTTIETIHMLTVFCYKGNAEVDDDYGVGEDDDDDNKEQWWCSGYKQDVRGSIPGLTATISEIGYLLLPSG